VRPLRLVRIALAAEALRLRYQLRRTVVRAAIGMIALALLLGALAFAHVAAWNWLRTSLAPGQIALIFAGVDLLLAMVLAWVALNSSPGTVEREARAVRERALDDANDSLSVAALLLRLIDLLPPLQPRQ
jgi:hypothetical protein